MSTAASPPASEAEAGHGPIVVMGVSGCGKSSVGERLAEYLGCQFIEGDSVHPAANVRKMRMGIPLDDADRWPWLDELGKKLRDSGDIVISCSALRRGYRERLRDMAGRKVKFIFLQGTRLVIEARMAARQGHYMPLSLLESQLATLEPPSRERGVITIDIDQSLEEIVSQALTSLAANAGARKTSVLRGIK